MSRVSFERDMEAVQHQGDKMPGQGVAGTQSKRRRHLI